VLADGTGVGVTVELGDGVGEGAGDGVGDGVADGPVLGNVCVMVPMVGSCAVGAWVWVGALSSP
jgi:hypothetical protein